MTRGFRNRAVMFSIFAIVLFIFAGIYLSSQVSTRNSYIELKDGKTELAVVTPLDETALSTRYGYVFDYNGASYYSITLLPYTADQMQSLTALTGGRLSVKFVLKGSKVDLSTTEKSADGLPIANSCEENYFYDSVEPGYTASIVIFAAGGIFAALVLMYIARILWIKSIEKNGRFAYGVFVEAYPSRFGSSRYMAVKYSYLNDAEEWVEAVTPYTYPPTTVELLKNLNAISIKYKGKSSAIVENFRHQRL